MRQFEGLTGLIRLTDAKWRHFFRKVRKAGQSHIWFFMINFHRMNKAFSTIKSILIIINKLVKRRSSRTRSRAATERLAEFARCVY